MSDCERHEPMLLAYVAGDLDDAELGPLLVHCRTCNGCRELLGLHRDLAVLASRAPEPSEVEFSALHERVLDEVDRRRGVSRNGRARVNERSTPWNLRTGRLTRAVATLAAGVVLFVVGLSAGRILSGSAAHPAAGASPSGSAAVADRLIEAISTDASSNHELSDVEDSRFTYSNVSFRRLEDGRIGLDFDVTTHVALAEPEQSAVVREVLVHSLLNPSTTGSRLKAMSYAAGAMEPKVREALIFAMRHDDNLAVRMKALTILSDRIGDPDVQAAVLATLRDDDSVQMRLLALDHLAAEGMDQNRIREVIENSARPGDEALLVRLGEHENHL